MSILCLIALSGSNKSALRKHFSALAQVTLELVLAVLWEVFLPAFWPGHWLTLTPGLYKTPSSLAISSEDLTFDAEGNENAVFIIQIASSLVLTTFVNF